MVWVLTAGAFFAFFVFGYVDNLKGPILPVLLDDLDFSYTTGGTLLLGSYFGFLVATLATGVLADRIGNKLILLAAGVLLTIGLFLFSIGNGFWSLALGMTLGGLGLGAIEVGGNNLIVEIHDAQRGRFLNLLGVFHGIGSFTVPVVASQLLLSDFSWRQIYQMALVLTVMLALFFLVVRYPRRQSSGEGGLGFGALRKVGFTRSMMLYYLLIAVYVAAELGHCLLAGRVPPAGEGHVAGAQLLLPLALLRLHHDRASIGQFCGGTDRLSAHHAGRLRCIDCQPVCRHLWAAHLGHSDPVHRPLLSRSSFQRRRPPSPISMSRTRAPSWASSLPSAGWAGRWVRGPWGWPMM